MSKFKTNVEFHDELRQCILATHEEQEALLPHGYVLIDKRIDNLSGFYAWVLKKGDEIVISCRGTDQEEFNNFKKTFNLKTSPDIKNDIAMGFRRHIPTQAYRTLQLYDEYTKRGYKITMTGDSLGASSCNIVSALRGGVLLVLILLVLQIF